MTAPVRSQATWIQTFTGRAFDLAAPSPADVDIVDIAHGLSLQTRFCGHCAWHYSVAQHCVLVARIVYATAPTEALGALLHDASEAYHADWSSPLKYIIRNIAPSALSVESAIESAICERFGVETRSPLIKAADLIMLATEKRDLFTSLRPEYADRNMAEHWFAATGYAQAQPTTATIEEWTPRRAEAEFLREFERYGGR